MEQSYSIHVLNILRDLIYAWLASIYSEIMAYRLNDIPAPHPSYPLPQSFPLGDFSIVERFHWTELDGETEIHHKYRAEFKFQGPPEDQWGALIWSISSGKPISFIVDLENNHRPFDYFRKAYVRISKD